MSAAEKINILTKTNSVCGFKIGNHQYAVSVLDVQEIIKSQMLTQVPLSPPYVQGLINLRGQIVTAVNLRKLFGSDKTTYDDHMNIIVEFEGSLYSLVVDEIMDVMNVDEACFEERPRTIDPNVQEFIKGVYKLDNSLLIFLNLEKILTFNNKEE